MLLKNKYNEFVASLKFFGRIFDFFEFLDCCSDKLRRIHCKDKIFLLDCDEIDRNFSDRLVTN